MFLISNSNYSLLVYREANDCHILTSNSANSYNHLFQGFVVGDSLEFSVQFTMLNRCGDSQHPCLAIYLKKKSFLPFNMLLAVGILYQVEEGHLYAMFAKNFYHKRANFSVFVIC